MQEICSRLRNMESLVTLGLARLCSPLSPAAGLCCPLSVVIQGICLMIRRNAAFTDVRLIEMNLGDDDFSLITTQAIEGHQTLISFMWGLLEAPHEVLTPTTKHHNPVCW